MADPSDDYKTDFFFGPQSWSVRIPCREQFQSGHPAQRPPPPPPPFSIFSFLSRWPPPRRDHRRHHMGRPRHRLVSAFFFLSPVRDTRGLRAAWNGAATGQGRVVLGVRVSFYFFPFLSTAARAARDARGRPWRIFSPCSLASPVNLPNDVPIEARFVTPRSFSFFLVTTLPCLPAAHVITTRVAASSKDFSFLLFSPAYVRGDGEGYSEDWN